MKKNIILFTILILLNIYVFGQGQWVTQNTGTSNYLTSVYFPSVDTGYTCDITGHIFKTTNGGSNWSNVSTLTTEFYCMHFINNDTGFIAGQKILKTNNGGISWQEVFPDSGFSFSYIRMLSMDTIVAVCWDGITNNKVFMSYNSGNTWNMIGAFQNPLTVSSVGCFINSKIGYVADGAGNVYKTLNGGSLWTSSSIGFNDIVFSMFYTDIDTGFAVGYTTGILFYTNNGGATWSQINTGFNNPLYSVYFTSHSIGYAVGGDGYNTGTVIKTNDGGNTWALATSTNLTFYCVHFPDANIGYASGDNGSILKYTSATGTNDNNSEINNICVYPNPVNDYAIINIPDYFIKNESILELSDLNGNLIKRYTLKQNTIRLNVSSLSSGIYTIKVKDKDKFVIKKIVKI